MPLTTEQQQQVIDHLENENAEITCKICRRGNLKVLPDMVCTPLAENSGKGLKIYVRDVISLVQVVCPECWHVEHFMAEEILNS